MHQPIREHLEEYLSGMEDPGRLQEFEDHLASCERCRREVRQMQQQAELLGVLRPPGELSPGPGFYARVVDLIESERIPSIWYVFLDPIFSRRLAYASLTLLLLLGTLLVTGGRRQLTSPDVYVYSPEVILSEQPTTEYVSDNIERDRDVVLVNLATYRY